MRYEFTACGHPNILATHPTTLEFTKEVHLSKRGDCILGVNTTFDLKKIKPLLTKRVLHISIILNGTKMRISAIPNREFSSHDEIVIRRSEFLSSRTLATRASHACNDIPRSWVKALQSPKQEVQVILSDEEAVE